MTNPTDEEREKVRSLAALGTSLEDICVLMGYKPGSRGTLQRRFVRELRDGPLLANASIGNVLYQKAQKGDLQAVKLWLSMRGKDQWRERTAVEVSGPGGGKIEHGFEIDLTKLSPEQLKALEPLLAMFAGSTGGTENRDG